MLCEETLQSIFTEATVTKLRQGILLGKIDKTGSITAHTTALD